MLITDLETRASGDTFLADDTFVSDSVARAQPQRTAPGQYSSYRDPVFGTTIRQLTGAATAGQGFVPEYSKAGAFNADGTRFLVRGTDGSTRLFDSSTMEELETLPLPEGDIEPRWSPVDPRVLTYLDNTGASQVRQYSTATGQSTVLGSYAGFGELSSGAEQDHSREGRYYAIHGDQVYSGDTWMSTRAFVADLKTGSRGPVTTLVPPAPGDFLDYVAITPDGNFVMVMWALTGAGLYTRDWMFVRQLTDWDEHADFCRTRAGEDVLVIAHYRAGPNDEVVEMVPVSGAASTVIWQASAYNLALHVSCRNTAMPGWAYLSSYWDGIGQRPGLTPFENEVFALSLDSSPGAPVVRRLAHTGMVERADYFDEPHATVSPDGRVILFGSNFGRYVDSDSFANTFAIDLRDGQPTASRPQTIEGRMVRRLRSGRSVALPRFTVQNRLLKWRTLTRKTCRYRRGRLAAREAGMCRLRASASAGDGWRAFNAIYRVRILRS